MEALLHLVLCSVLLALAACNLSIDRKDLLVVATSYDMDAKTPVAAIGHFNLSVAQSNMHVDVPNFDDWPFVIGSGTLGPWLYAVFTDDGSGSVCTVHDLQHGNKTEGCTIRQTLEEIHCGSTTCYAIDIDSFAFVSVDPFTCKTKRLLTYDGLLYSGLIEDASTFDPVNLVHYVILTGLNNKEHLMAADLTKSTFTKVDDSFAVNNSGPFCFDPLLGGLVSLGSPLGAVVAFNTTSQTTRVLRKADLGGIVGSASVDCLGGTLVAGIIDFHKRSSPTLLVAIDFLTSSDAFHNSTANPEFHYLNLADRSADHAINAAATAAVAAAANAR
jgi:hypothetical protein